VLGQAVKAFVVPVAGTRLTVERIRRHCAACLEDYMVPKHVEIRPELPRGTTGKVDKRALM
jgi:acyl-CoA synthetase (AMP-forming)/AMP-acid ligase II